MRLTFESIDWVEQFVLPNVVNLTQSVEVLNRKKRLSLTWVRENFSCLTTFKLRLWPCSCLQTWTVTVDHPTSGACQPSDCNHTISTPGSPASQLTLKILRLVNLSVSTIHEPIPYTNQSMSTPCLPQECIYSIGLFLSRTLINTIIKVIWLMLLKNQ